MINVCDDQTVVCRNDILLYFNILFNLLFIKLNLGYAAYTYYDTVHIIAICLQTQKQHH